MPAATPSDLAGRLSLIAAAAGLLAMVFLRRQLDAHELWWWVVASQVVALFAGVCARRNMWGRIGTVGAVAELLYLAALSLSYVPASAPAQ